MSDMMTLIKDDMFQKGRRVGKEELAKELMEVITTHKNEEWDKFIKILSKYVEEG